MTAAQFAGERTDDKIVRSRIFIQSLDSLWERWTTKEGLKILIGNPSHLELYPGGRFEIAPHTTLSGMSLEGSSILTLLPKRVLSFSVNVDARFEEAKRSGMHTWVVLEFEPVSWNETRLVLTHIGWPSEPSWKPVWEAYSAAWDQVFNNLAALDGEMKSQVKYGAVGIGGVFFKCEDSKKLKQWYHDYLGLDTNDYGATFEWLLADGSGKKGMTQWSPFSATTQYFSPSTKDYMINYRVHNIELLIEQLKAKGVEFTDELQVYDYGKFIHLMDPEGNKIELWEATD